MDGPRQPAPGPSPPAPYSFRDASPHPVLACRRNGSLTYCNQAAEALVAALGLDSALELLPAEHRRIANACFGRKQPTSAEAVVGERVIAWSYCPLPGEAAVYLFGVDVARHRPAPEPPSDSLPMDALNEIAMGIVGVDEDLQVQFANRAAQGLLSADMLSIRAGRLSCGLRPLHEEIRNLVARACRGDVQPVAVSIPRPGLPGLEVLISPLAGDQHPVAVVQVFDVGMERASIAEILVSLYRLTPSEARLAELLSAGLSLESTAVTLAISRQTAKNHLQAVFAKTGTHRQSELVARILGGAASAAGRGPE